MWLRATSIAARHRDLEGPPCESEAALDRTWLQVPCLLRMLEFIYVRGEGSQKGIRRPPAYVAASARDGIHTVRLSRRELRPGLSPLDKRLFLTRWKADPKNC